MTSRIDIPEDIFSDPVSAPTSDPFGDPGGGLLRDQWDRPLILRPWEEPGPCPDAAGKRWRCYITAPHRHYTRASTFAGSLDNGPGLGIWMKRHVALAFSDPENEDLAGIVAGMSYDDGKKLDEYIDECLNRVSGKHKSLKAANNGTAVHRFTEPNSPPSVPERYRKDVEAFAVALMRMQCPHCEESGFEIVETERFFVNDRYIAAGTADHLVKCDHCKIVLVLDKKTGKDIHPIAMTIQLTTYAGGLWYDEDMGTRIELPYNVSQEWAVIAHIPLGTGECYMHAMDLTVGRKLAELAMVVNGARNFEKDLHRLLPS